jgi:redox-sensitive bicupin YhaK (pirin superfamily)
MFKHSIKKRSLIMETVFHPSTERGHANHGWLDSYHSFSFASWYEPSKIHFGALRVLNDDIVAGGGGFGAHPHDNMEIVSIPLMGALAHKDSNGNEKFINTGDVQIMSAGTGLHHSEYNASKTEPVNFLQIWVFPKVNNIKPHYDQKTFDSNARKNNWQIVVSPDEKDGGLWINQDAVFARTSLDQNTQLNYVPKFAGNGVYLFVIEGSIEVNGQTVNKRDAVGVSNIESVEIIALADADVLVIEVPMIN